jgi:hypothetical protein
LKICKPDCLIEDTQEQPGGRLSKPAIKVKFANAVVISRATWQPFIEIFRDQARLRGSLLNGLFSGAGAPIVKNAPREISDLHSPILPPADIFEQAECLQGGCGLL